MQHFVESVKDMPRDLVDCTAVHDELDKEDGPFSSEQRLAMKRAVSAHMANSPALAAGSGSGSGDSKAQTHLYIHNYITDKLWCSLLSKDVSFDGKLEGVASFFIDQLRLRHPNEDTSKNAVAIVALCCGRELTPDEAYGSLNKFKAKIVAKRGLKPEASSLRLFPEDPTDFMVMYPQAYIECEPPVATRLDPNRIRQSTRKDLMPARSSNKNISRHSPSPPSDRRSPGLSLGAGENLFQNCLSYVLRGEGHAPSAAPADDIGLNIFGQLANRPPRPSSVPPCQERQPRLEIADREVPQKAASVNDVIAQAREVLNKKKAPKKGKAEPTNNSSSSSDVTEPSTVEYPSQSSTDDESGGSKVEKLLKKPAKAVKTKPMKAEKLKKTAKVKRDHKKKGSKKKVKKDKKVKKEKKDKKEKKVKPEAKTEKKVKPDKVVKPPSSSPTEKEKAKMYKRLPDDFKDTFLRKTKAKTAKKNTFQCRGYDKFKKTDRETAKAAFHKCGEFWDKVNNK